MKVNCTQHRNSMELLGLKLRLADEPLDPAEREELQARIRELEQQLDLD